MDRLTVRWIRLAVVAGAIAGSALVSSAVVAADESPPTDGSIVVEAPPDLPLEDIEVIEMVIVESGVTEPAASESESTEAPLGDTEGEVEVGRVLPDEPVADVLPDEPVADVLPDEPVADVLPDEPVADALEHVDVQGGSGHAGGSEHAGNQGGSVGEGRPYLVTFEVEWRDPQGTPIGVLDAVLALEWRSVFELSAASQTGQGRTSATCTYPAGSDVLQCVFETAGHGPGSNGLDGLIVPGSKKARYTVTVVWPSTDWTIDGADDGPYSARESCPRGQGGGGHDDGGGGHDDGGGGHDDGGGGHDDGGGGGGQGGGGHRTFACPHRVVMQQIAVVVPPTDPPVVDPEPEAAPPVVPAPEAIAPVIPPLEVVRSAPAAGATQRALPATGSSVSVLLVLAGLLVVTGSTVALFSRRTS